MANLKVILEDLEFTTISLRTMTSARHAKQTMMVLVMSGALASPNCRIAEHYPSLVKTNLPSHVDKLFAGISELYIDILVVSGNTSGRKLPEAI